MQMRILFNRILICFNVAEQAEKIPQLNWGWIKKL